MSNLYEVRQSNAEKTLNSLKGKVARKLLSDFGMEIHRKRLEGTWTYGVDFRRVLGLPDLGVLSNT